jgi:hypothetical protein
VDSSGRAVVVFVASQLPAKPENMDRILLYMLSVLDPIVAHDYNVVYLHALLASHNKPGFAWLKQVFNIFNRKYKKNLKRLFIVHPTFWVKYVIIISSLTPLIVHLYDYIILYIYTIMDTPPCLDVSCVMCAASCICNRCLFWFANPFVKKKVWKKVKYVPRVLISPSMPYLHTALYSFSSYICVCHPRYHE